MKKALRERLKRARKKKISHQEEGVLLAREQVILSKERTVLSFMRTGLAFIGAGVVILNIFANSFTSLVTGVALILIGFVEIMESYRRLSAYKRKIEKIKKALGYEL
jgi:uncharacterized membrane protein YidH (DUF202 family)